MTDLPLSRLSHAQRERRALVLARDRHRKRIEYLRLTGGHEPGWNLPASTVLQDWFVDEHGCQARRMGCEGDGG